MISSSLYNVMTESENKDVLFNFRLHPELREDFHAATLLRGTTGSNSLHQYIMKYVREVRAEVSDDEFLEAKRKVQEKEESKRERVKALAHARKKKRSSK